MRVFGTINNPVHYCAIMGMSLPLIIGQLFYIVKKENNLPLSLKPLVFISAYYLVIAALVVILDINSKSIVWVFNYLIMLSIPFIYHAKESFKGQSKQNQINILFNCMILVLYATYLSYSRATWVGLTASLGLMFSITSIIDYQFNKRNLFIILGGSLLFTLLTYLFLIFNIASISTNFEVISFYWFLCH